MVFRAQELPGQDHIVNLLMGEGLHFGVVYIPVDIDTLGLLGKYYRHVEILRRNAGDADAGSLDGQDLGDLVRGEAAAEFLSDLIDQVNIHLVVEKAVYLQYISRLYNAVSSNTFFQKFHNFIPLWLSYSL